MQATYIKEPPLHKRRYIVVIFTFIILFRVTNMIGLDALILQCTSALIGQLTHAQASTANNRAESILKLAARHKLCKCVT